MTSDRMEPLFERQPHLVGRLRSVSTYNDGCRCDDCREANRIEQRRTDANRRASWTGDHPEGKPFSVSTYDNWGCRCDECTAVHSEKCRRNRVERSVML